MQTIFRLLFWIIEYKYNHRKNEYCHLTNYKISDFLLITKHYYKLNIIPSGPSKLVIERI